MSYGARTLSAACGRPVHFHPICGSTNRIAAELAAGGAPGGSLVVAEAQSGGRGRLGRSWASPPGLNIYLSLVLRPRLPAARAPLICLAAAVGAADALPELTIKWPNDLLIGERKVGGILAEVALSGDRLDHAVLGLGLNVNQRDFPGLPGAGSLALARGADQDRTALLAALVPAIEARVAQLERAPAIALESWRLRSATLGRRVRVAGIEGRAEALRDDGALLLRTERGLEPVLAGDVEMVRLG